MEDDIEDPSSLWDQYLLMPMGSLEALEMLTRIVREEFNSKR